ncbi:MAG: SDR family NAD(P)-dependent oxidoreductase [Gemmataceae bacterium]
MSSFHNQVALVTGAGSGLGRALVQALAAEGAAVAGIDLQAEPLRALETELTGQRFAWGVADVTEREALFQVVAELRDQLGPIDLLIASAGIGRRMTAAEFSLEDFAAQIQVNLLGVAHSIAAVLPAMLERQHGHLAAISSLASYRGLPFMAGYCASKSGVNALLDALRVELQPLGIHVTTICPGWVRTPLTEHLHLPPRQLMEPAEAARIMLQALRRRRPFVAFPAHAAWRVRVLRWLPPAVGDWLIRRQFARWHKK